jgi:hypothetical protein
MPKMKMKNLAVFNLIAKHLHATNPKDQIYELLGIMGLIVEIDYSDSMSVRALYSTFAELRFAAGNGSSILSTPGVGWNAIYINPFNLPLWVPDWYTPGYGPKSPILINWFGVYSANAGMRTSSSTVVSNGTLLARGCVCEMVQHHVFRRTTANISDPIAAAFKFCVQFIRSRASKLSGFRTTLLQMLFRTLLLDLCPINLNLRDSAKAIRLYSD